ncbi:MAG TPA: DUF2934 domain-containing protein [Burkholderiales bacterium]|nr:DUF2934 domain-containing protein [Burkholderiales bacterium]
MDTPTHTTQEFISEYARLIAAGRHECEGENGAPMRPDAAARRRMIEAAAYHRAEQRGFQGGDPVEDWLAAEAEVDALLGGC